MAYVYDNKTYRNLQQQVKENMDNIAELQDMKLVGIDVAGIVADYSSLPSSAEQGQLYAVGTSSPYELYVYNNSSWVDFGEFPKAGPQGDQGPQGEPGRQGPRGLTGPQGPKGYTGAPGTPGRPGPQGDKGPKGDKGDPGWVDAFAKDAASVTTVGQAYVDSIGYLQVCTSLSPLTFEQGGYIKGPMGSRGIQGPQGEQGPKGDTGPQGPVGPQGPKGDTGKLPPDVATETYVDDRYLSAKDYADKQIANAGTKIISKIPTKTSQLTNDSDLVTSTELSSVAFSGKYNDLTDKPTIPTTTSQLTNDSGFVTSNSLATVATSGSYNDLSDRPLFNYKSDVIKDNGIIKTIYGGSKLIFKNGGNPGSIIDNKVDLSLPELTWGTHGAYTEYAYIGSDIAEACYKCWRAWIDVRNLKTNDTIYLKLTYTDSTGSTITTTGTGLIHSNSFIDPSLPKHQIRLTSVSFSQLNISNATFRIQPQYDQIFITGDQLVDSNGQLVTNITISMNIDGEHIIYNKIDSNFIGYDIARTENIPTTTGELTNDSGFITSAALTGYATETWVGEQGYQTASDVSTALSGYTTTSDVSTAVSTAISSQTKETWTFTLSDGSTVTKTVVLGA